MLTRVFYACHGAAYAFLIYLGFYYLAVDAKLVEEFFKVGWEHYDGPSLRSPENAYYRYWVIACICSIVMVLTTKREQGLGYSKLEKLLLGVATFFGCVYGILYLGNGGASMKESMIWWIFSGVIQVGLSILLLYEKIISTTIYLGQKYIYGANGLLYLALLGLGFYYYQWDIAILEERNAVGWENYQGPDRDDPENAYHLILIIATILSLVFGFFDKDNKATKALKVYKGLFVSYFLYSGFVYINDGNPDMGETRFWWVSFSIAAMISSFVLFWKTENKLPEKEVVYNDNILDDFSSLE